MRNGKKLPLIGQFTAALGAVVIAFSVISSPTEARGSNWYPELGWEASKFGLILTEPLPAGFSNFSTTVFKNANDRNRLRNHVARYDCQSLEKFPCIPTNTTFLAGQVVAPVCSGKETNCLSRVFAQTDSGRVSGNFIGYIKEKQFPAKPEWGLRGRGVSLSLWNFPGVLHEGGSSTYAVSVDYSVHWEKGRFRMHDFRSSIVPYSSELGENFPEMSVHPRIDSEGRPDVGYGGPSNGCVWLRKGECGKAFSFSKGTKFGLDIKFDKELSTWFKARLTDTDISVRSISNRDNLISVSGSPIEVPIFAYSLDFATLPKQIEKFLRSEGVEVVPGVKGTSNDWKFSTSLVDVYRKYVGDKSAGEISVWTFSNIAIGPYLFCLSGTSKISGIVSTNAMSYQGDPPVFRNGFLEYEVSGMHYLQDGESLAIGSYELLIDSKVARCLYGLPDVPLSATISVVNEKGKKV